MDIEIDDESENVEMSEANPGGNINYLLSRMKFFFFFLIIVHSLYLL